MTSVHTSISEVLPCAVAGCLKMMSCERKTEICRCKIDSGETLCSLKIPQVTESTVHQTRIYKQKQQTMIEKSKGKAKQNKKDSKDQE